jgi:hypothetical protein
MGDEEVKATIFGTPISIKGLAAMVVVVLAVALGGLIYLIVTVNGNQHVQQTEQETREHESVVDALRTMNETNEKIGNLVNEQNFMLLSDEKERKAMKDRLRMPSSLSHKLRGEPD